MTQALDPIHAEAALRELQLAQRLSAGGVYSTAREAGTKAMVLLGKAMGLAADQTQILETWCIGADIEVQREQSDKADSYEQRRLRDYT